MTAPPNFAALVRAAGAGYADLSIFNDEPLAWVMTIKGVNLTGAAFSGQVIPTLDAAVGDQALTFGTPTLVGGDTVLTVSLTESQVEGLGTAASAAEPLTLFYNIKCTPAGGAKQTIIAGRLTRVGS
jgi:hypothetical protein